MLNPWRRPLLALGVAAIVLSACGGSASSSSPSRADDAALAVRPESAANALPAVIVHDLRSGQQVQLKNLLPAVKPVLVWFWAPH